jgi:transcriptional regulator with XRE-family HTH domain
MAEKSSTSKTTSVKSLPPAIRRANRQLGEDVKTWRKLRSLTQTQLADRAGISRGVLSRLENGGEGVSLESFLRVLRALGVLESLTRALDPYQSDVGRLRSNEVLPKRIRPSRLTS